jgi:hypothetical protein
MPTAREAVATAASTVDGVDVAAKYRQSLTAYTGFVKWNGRQRDDSGFGWMDSWQVWLALPQDVKTAEQWLADHLDELVSAVDDELVVTSAIPADLVLPGGSTNGLIIEGTRATA